MANEITEFGMSLVYGGPQITLAGSDLGNKIDTLLLREGSGSARAYKQFRSGRADYLNTKKVLNPGDNVTVYAKTLPMDFPVQTAGASSSDTGVFVAPAGQAQTLFGSLITSRFQFGAPVFTVGAGSVAIQLNGGAFLAYDAFNSALAALSDAQVQAASIPFTVRLTQTNNAAATVEMAIS
jgi:hypothetical protein